MKNLLVFVVMGAVLSGCASTGLYSRTGAALITRTTEGEMANYSTPGKKAGRACAKNVLGIVAWGDASVEAARKAAAITAVTNLSHEYNNTLFVYGEYCVVVQGN